MSKDIYDSPSFNKRRKNIFYENSQSFLATMKECSTLEEIKRKNETATFEFFKTTPELFNQFLLQKFRIKSIIEFLDICHRKKINFTLPNNICVAFKNEANYAELSHFFLYHNNLVLRTYVGNFLNLHDKMLYKFILIHANFDLEKCTAGFHYSTDSFQFLIKNSALFDLTVAYNDVRKDESL